MKFTFLLGPLATFLIIAFAGCSASQQYARSRWGEPIYLMAEGGMGEADPGDGLEQGPPPPEHSGVDGLDGGMS